MFHLMAMTIPITINPSVKVKELRSPITCFRIVLLPPMGHSLLSNIHYILNIAVKLLLVSFLETRSPVASPAASASAALYASSPSVRIGHTAICQRRAPLSLQSHQSPNVALQSSWQLLGAKQQSKHHGRRSNEASCDFRQAADIEFISTSADLKAGLRQPMAHPALLYAPQIFWLHS